MENCEDKYEELEQYADMEGCELGDACHMLLTIRSVGYLNDEFLSEVEKEIDRQLIYFRENTEVVTEEVQSRPLTVKRLAFKGE